MIYNLINALYKGYHLSKQELEQIKPILETMLKDVEQRLLIEKQ